MKKHMLKLVGMIVLAAVIGFALASCDNGTTPPDGPIPTEITYKVTFNSNGGNDVATQIVKAGSMAIHPKDPIKDGKVFTGWYSDAELTEIYNFSTQVNEDITLYASWVNPETPQYWVTFNSNGGSEVEPQQVYEGERANKPSDPTRTGYAFMGWYTSESFSVLFQFTNPITGPCELFARWDTVYTVQYNANGGEGTMTQTLYTIGVTEALLTNTFTRRSYSFLGWATAPGATAPTYTDGQLVTNLTGTPGGNVILYAVWGLVTIVTGANLDAKFAWLDSNAINDIPYVVEVDAYEQAQNPRTFSYPGYDNVIIKLTGGTDETSTRTVNLSGNGSLFTILSGVTLVLDGFITLQGHSNNTRGLILVDTGGALEMNTGSVINGNKNGGVNVQSGSIFTMNGGTISSNISYWGGGVYVEGTFTMNGGTISGNTCNEYGGGGGVYVYVKGTFTMNGGTISGNTNNAYAYGGGVCVDGTFTMKGGKITGNNGNGVSFGYDYYENKIFTMNSGEISSNTSEGVLVYGSSSTFTMNGGTISGNTNYGVNLQRGSFNMSGGEISENINKETGYYFGGAGVHVSGGTFTMSNGTITGNISPSGGGVYVSSNGSFIMSDGTISGNIASAGGGGGVYIQGNFTMSGGTITGNSASGFGGGILIENSIVSIITGTIHGSNETTEGLRNIAAMGDALYLNHYGIAQYGNGSTWTPLPLTVNFDSSHTDNTIRVVNGVLK